MHDQPHLWYGDYMTNFKPAGYSSASPYLMVSDADATMAFAESAFQAERLRIHHRDDGGIMHAEIRIDDSVVMMGEVPEAQVAHVHVYVRDADESFAKAIASGGVLVQAMKRSGDGDYRGGVTDPNGIVWWISQQDQ